jgi:hypothetical protein
MLKEWCMLRRSSSDGVKDRAAALNRSHVKQEQFVEEIARENHTRKKFVPAALYFSLTLWRQLKPARPALPEPEPKSDRPRRCSPGTLLSNRSHAKRKRATRGRTR